jgi:quinol-cytochrome oxidoreductase complex cytochrome b subunit
MKAPPFLVATLVVFLAALCLAYPVITSKQRLQPIYDLLFADCNMDVQSCSKATKPTRPVLIVPGWYVQWNYSCLTFS